MGHHGSDGFTLKSRRKVSPDRVLIPICVGFSFLWFLFLDAPLDVRGRVFLVDLAIKGVGMIPFTGITSSFAPAHALLFWDCCNCLGALSIATVIACGVDQSLFDHPCDVYAHSCWAISFYLYFSVTVIHNVGPYMVASRLMYALTWMGTVGLFYGTAGMSAKLALGMLGICALAMGTHVLSALRDEEEYVEEQAEVDKILEQQDNLGKVEYTMQHAPCTMHHTRTHRIIHSHLGKVEYTMHHAPYSRSYTHTLTPWQDVLILYSYSTRPLPVLILHLYSYCTHTLTKVYEEMRAQHEELKSLQAVDLNSSQIDDLDTLVADGSLRQLFSKHIAGEMTVTGSMPSSSSNRHSAFDMLDTFLRNVKVS
jgi:hypothetical protein